MPSMEMTFRLLRSVVCHDDHQTWPHKNIDWVTGVSPHYKEARWVYAIAVVVNGNIQWKDNIWKSACGVFPRHESKGSGARQAPNAYFEFNELLGKFISFPQLYRTSLLLISILISIYVIHIYIYIYIKMIVFNLELCAIFMIVNPTTHFWNELCMIWWLSGYI